MTSKTCEEVPSPVAAKPAVRRFRVTRTPKSLGWWPPCYDYVEFNGPGLQNCELVHTDGFREPAYWSLSFALSGGSGYGAIIEIPVRKYKVGDRVRIVSGTVGNIGRSGTVTGVTEGGCFDYSVKHAGLVYEADELFHECNLEPLTWKKGDRVAYSLHGMTGEGTVVKDGLQDGRYVDVATRSGRSSSGFFLPEELELLPAVAQAPAPEKPIIRWFVDADHPCKDDFLYIEFAGDKGTYYFASGKTTVVVTSLGAIASFSCYKEVFEKPTAPAPKLETPVAEPKVHNLNDFGGAPFYTVTDAKTEATNSRSKRYDSEHEALAEATERVKRGSPSYADGVYVLKAVKLVKA